MLRVSSVFLHDPLEGCGAKIGSKAYCTTNDKFAGKYANRVINGGVGHNLPQEAPRAFAQAIIDVAS
jgi:hypothetical protein